MFENLKNNFAKFYNSVWSFVRTRVKTSILIVVILGVSGYFLYSYLSPKPSTIRYITASPSRQTLIQKVSGTGTVALANLKNINFSSAGTVQKINFKIGDQVKSGDVIATIDKTNLQNTLAQSQSALNQAQNNQKNRTISNQPTKYDIANLQESTKTAQIKLENDKFNLDQSILNSPVNGKVVSINNQIGDTIQIVNADSGLPTQSDQIALNNAVKSAQTKVDQDKQNLDAVTLMSPFSGTVTAVNYNAGDQISTGGSTVSNVTQYDINNLQNAVATAQQNLNNATSSTQQASAQVALSQANNNLQKALNTGSGFAVIRDKITNEPESVNFATSGKLKTVNISVGSVVTAGASLLGTLDPSTIQTQLNQDQSALDLAIYNAQKAPSSNALMVVSNSENNNQNQNISFLVSGRLSELNVKVGDTISKGQLLAKLDQTSFKQAVGLSQSSLNQTQNNLANRYASNAPTQYDLANLNEAVNVAKIKVSTDKYNLDHADLVSPFDGTLTDLKIGVGDTVQAGSISSQSTSTSSSSTSTSTSSSSAVAVISDLEHPIINMSVGESDISKINANQLVQVTLDALAGKTFVAKVDFIDPNPTITSSVVSYNVKIAFTKSDPEIKPGMSATANIITQTKDNVLTVPASAVKSTNGQSTVQIMPDSNPNTTPQTVNVQTGLFDDTNIEILDGLSETDTVVTSTINSANRTTASTSLINLGGGGGANRGGGAPAARPGG